MSSLGGVARAKQGDCVRKHLSLLSLGLVAVLCLSTGERSPAQQLNRCRPLTGPGSGCDS